ncbi:MAG: alpha/beta hydrolase [Clostridia bacterium]|nr:alpha/beta hydrolase [Clostridia bacterium]
MIFEYEDLKIHYEIFESDEAKNSGKKPLLLLHGWMAQIESLAPVYLNFMKTRKVYVVDFPGQAGKSSELTKVWGVPEYSYMILAFIENQGIRGCDVIGHSFGGRVCIYLASKHSDLFSKIVLTDAAGVKPKRNIIKTFKIYSYKFLKNVSKFFMSKEKHEEYVNKLRAKRGSSDYSKLSSDLMRQTFNKIIELDLTSNLKDIKNSTLLVWGRNDTDTPLYMAKIMEKNIVDSGLVIIENAGHFSYLDNPNQFLLVANEFLK